MSNRLAFEDSPYLQQHKNNPVDWYGWCDEAFERAAQEHKAIFISIGYSSCHWCHVMEHEVFENSSIAEFVNQHFICIKVDREERPDIDKHYQELHTLLNRRAGGWPLSIFCTPENKPFYAATYIPPYNRAQMMGFSELTAIIAEKVALRDEKLFQNADEISGYLRPKNDPVQATALNDRIITQFIQQARHNYDVLHGGFSKAPKFPHASTLETLISIERLRPDKELRAIITHTLDAMAQGGMFDLIDGGFCRYSTDEEWLVPHFEKMTYDNALLCALYANAGMVYKNDRYLQIAEETASFMLRFMIEDNLFYSASDADTEGEEGKYFIYTYDEILDALRACALTDDLLTDAAISLGASEKGNFEGHCILRLSSQERPEWFEPFKNILQKLRAARAYPFIDRKIITAWNAMMIRALLILGKHKPAFKDQALQTLDALLSTMNKNGALQHSALIHKAPKIDAFLEDYAYVCTALIEAYQSTLDERYLISAQQFAHKALELFYEEGKWYFSRGAFPTLGEFDDGTYPSAMAIMIDALLSLGMLIDPKYRHFAFKSLEYASIKLMKTPIYYPKLTQQAIRTIAGERLVKASSANLAKLSAFDYPFVNLRNDETLDNITVCSENACFSATQNFTKVNDLIRTSL